MPVARQPDGAIGIAHSLIQITNQSAESRATKSECYTVHILALELAALNHVQIQSDFWRLILKQVTLGQMSDCRLELYRSFARKGEELVVFRVGELEELLQVAHYLAARRAVDAPNGVHETVEHFHVNILRLSTKK